MLLRKDGPLAVDFFYILKNLPWAISFLKNCKKEKVNEIANSLTNLSYIFLEQNKIIEAKQYLLRALELRKIVNNTSSLAETYYGLCNLYWHEGNFEKAKEYAKISLKSAKSINDNQIISSAANYLSKIENKLGLYDSALVHYNVFINAKNTFQDTKLVAHLSYLMERLMEIQLI